MNPLRTSIESYQDELVAIRRDLHANPETGFEEVRTASIVAGKLREWGVEVTEGVGRTGVVGTIRGNGGSGRSIGLRADMDALPIHEATGLAYASRTAGKMHACGHDGHTTMLLGAARYLAQHRNFSGTVNVIFQPAEEGLGGAPAMLRDGLFDRFPCEQVFGLHNSPGSPVGTFALREGPLMAASGRFEVTFTGKGGHAGMMDHARFDLTTVLARYVLALQDIVAKDVPAGEVAVIRVGELEGHGGTSLNIMPAKVYVGGTMRCFTTAVQEVISRRMEEVAQSLVLAAADAAVEVRLRWLTIPVVNAGVQTKAAASAAGSVGGAKVESMEPITGGEDFAYMMEARPGAFIFMGNGTADDGHPYGVHTPKYDFNDKAIPYGVEYWVRLAQQELGR